MENNKDFMSATEAAKELKLTTQRIGVFCRQGRLKGAKKIGFYWVIPSESVRTFIRQPHGIKKKTPKRSDDEMIINNTLNQLNQENNNE